MKVSEDRQKLVPLKVAKYAKPISSHNSKSRARQRRRIALHNSVREIASALNYMYDDKVGYERASVKRQLASAKRCRVPAVQSSVVRYLRERSQKAWCRGLLKPCESADRIGLRLYSTMVGAIERSIPLDPRREKFGLVEPGKVASAKMLKLLPGRLGELHSKNT